MVSAINSALSGLNAASRRLENSANNIANQFSTTSTLNGQPVDKPFVPKVVQQVTLESGGVATVVNDKDPASVPFFDPDSPQANEQGLVQFPNVDTAQELVGQQIAAYDFKANLKTIETYNKMQQKLLDIIS